MKMQEIIATSTWGFGEGANRHLVGDRYPVGAWSACYLGRYGLYYFDADPRPRGDLGPTRDVVLAKPKCSRCRDLDRGAIPIVLGHHRSS